MSRVKDITGQRFGRLQVVKIVGKDKRHNLLYECICDCGNTTVTNGTLLRAGKTRSCGCLAKNNFDRTTHGLSHTPLYGVWRTMKTRCYDRNSNHYKNYGARGIVICDEWKNNFKAFYDWSMANGYAKGLTIDRMNVDGNYEPENCRWVTQREQCNNKTTNRYITYKGQTKTIHEFADEYGIKYTTLWARINTYHWDVEKAIKTP